MDVVVKKSEDISIKGPSILQEQEMPKSYEEGINLIANELNRGGHCLLMACWNCGKVLSFMQAVEGVYGKKVVERAAEQLKRPPRLFWDMLRFYKEYPEYSKAAKLGVDWTTLRLLLQIPDIDVRDNLMQEVVKEDLTTREVKDRVEEVSGKEKKEKTEKKEKSALKHFAQLESCLEDAIANVQHFTADNAEMLQIMVDEKRTPEEDYKKCCSKLKTISKAGLRLQQVIVQLVIPLKDSIDDSPSVSGGNVTTTTEKTESVTADNIDGKQPVDSGTKPTTGKKSIKAAAEKKSATE